MTETGLGLDRAQESKGSISPTRLCMKAWYREKGRSFAFSAPGGMDGCEGKGITRVSIELGGELARRGERRGRLAGVTTMVRERRRKERWCTRSSRGRRWPCAGNGMINTCGTEADRNFCVSVPFAAINGTFLLYIVANCFVCVEMRKQCQKDKFHRQLWM